MKITANRFTAALFAAALSFLPGTASAETIVRIGGAQAFGDAVHRAIAHLLGAIGPAPYTLAPGNTYAFTGSDINKAQKSIWTTASFPGVPGQVIIETSFTGSTDGIRVVAQNVPINFLKTTTPQSQSGTSNTPDSASNWEALPPDAAAVDSFQSSTVYTSPTLVDRLVGAGAYVFVASKEAPARLNNITTQLAQALWNTGNLPLALFTNDPADRTSLVNSTRGDANLPGGAAGNPVQVYATGRDYGFGARILAYNGVPYSPQAVAEGSYSLWAYEHILYKNSVSADQKTVLEAFAEQLRTTNATLLISELKVSRPVDGGIITQTY